MSESIVKEGSTCYVSVSFTDKNGAAAVPDSVTYRVDCLTSGEAIRAETALVAASEIEITLTPDDNAIQDQLHPYERRIVTVMAVYGAEDACNDEYIYRVRNLSKVS